MTDKEYIEKLEKNIEELEIAIDEIWTEVRMVILRDYDANKAIDKIYNITENFRV